MMPLNYGCRVTEEYTRLVYVFRVNLTYLLLVNTETVA